MNNNKRFIWWSFSLESCSSITDLYFRFIASCVLSGPRDASMWRCSVVRADRTLPLWWSLHSSLMPTVSGLASWQQCHAVTFWYWEPSIYIQLWGSYPRHLFPHLTFSALCPLSPPCPGSAVFGLFPGAIQSSSTCPNRLWSWKFLQLPRFGRSVCESSFMIQS